MQTAREIVLRALFMKWDESEECHDIELGIISTEPPIGNASSNSFWRARD